ncbi:LytTR family DNA-binding domain-containing protein [Chryseolinea sp. T2]|uniref:LytR/AlgR family response regulator transcription factor n=1 Tax=Chryseolinea sp. T2 TaxID=3129255 RepID=UPI00307732C6
MIKTIIVDDEIHCLDTLNILLKEHCPTMNVVQQCKSGEEGYQAINFHKPDVVFLDIEMPGMNGFDMLKKLSDVNFSVIFTTGYDQYAITAIHLSALDYLLKPIAPSDLIGAVRKLDSRKQFPSKEQFGILLDKLSNPRGSIARFAIPTFDGFELVSAEAIICCTADDNYTRFQLKNDREIIACRTLKQIEESLESFPFFLRVHHSYLVNMNEVVRYVRGEGGYLVMSDGRSVNVSRSRKESLLRLFVT